IVADAPGRPAPGLLAPTERRRAPATVAVALQVAQAACAMAGRDPAQLPSVFASTHGDLAITDYMCATLATDATALSPIRFHNSVHNAAAGYWTIGTGCMRTTTAVSAWTHTFGNALLEVAAQLACEREPVLLVAYDIAATGPLATMACSDSVLGLALLLAPTRCDAARARLRVSRTDSAASVGGGALCRALAGNAMAHALPLAEALAAATPTTRVLALDASAGLQIEVEPCPS
ncbi:MAG TPA: beta-ketoacyl synthase chain length factor, partial [Xanthomonadaceae bacterium]|nr:beta-ketoacyl synthase chain length factor [Xanthomonadaceae bacterium]